MGEFIFRCVTSFHGFLEKDTSLTNTGVHEHLGNHFKIEGVELWKNVISVEATVIGKLALKMGMEVRIENELLPKQLLSIHELECYYTYDFLENPLITNPNLKMS
jgi:hypothetical protein